MLAPVVECSVQRAVRCHGRRLTRGIIQVSSRCDHALHTLIEYVIGRLNGVCYVSEAWQDKTHYLLISSTTTTTEETSAAATTTIIIYGENGSFFSWIAHCLEEILPRSPELKLPLLPPIAEDCLLKFEACPSYLEIHRRHHHHACLNC